MKNVTLYQPLPPTGSSLGHIHAIQGLQIPYTCRVLPRCSILTWTCPPAGSSPGGSSFKLLFYKNSNLDLSTCRVLPRWQLLSTFLFKKFTVSPAGSSPGSLFYILTLALIICPHYLPGSSPDNAKVYGLTSSQVIIFRAAPNMPKNF